MEKISELVNKFDSRSLVYHLDTTRNRLEIIRVSPSSEIITNTDGTFLVNVQVGAKCKFKLNHIFCDKPTAVLMFRDHMENVIEKFLNSNIIS